MSTVGATGRATPTRPARWVALAGNPNAGKSTLFNALTGTYQHVANWPGTTVSYAAGSFHQDGIRVAVVDLPGTYSLAASSPEEAIARDYLLREQPDMVVNVVDATALERHLYLTVQLLELGRPLVVAVTMIDRARQHGLALDLPALSTALGGVPVVAVVAARQEGLDELRQAIVRWPEEMP